MFIECDTDCELSKCNVSRIFILCSLSTIFGVEKCMIEQFRNCTYEAFQTHEHFTAFLDIRFECLITRCIGCRIRELFRVVIPIQLEKKLKILFCLIFD